MRSTFLVAVTGALAIAGCGSYASKPSHSSPGLVAGIKYADCTRANGVPSFPDPPGGGGGVQVPNSGLPAKEGRGERSRSPRLQGTRS